MSRWLGSVRLSAAGFLVAGLLSLGYAAHVYLDTKLYQAGEHRRFEQARAVNIALPEPPEARAVVEGSSIGEIQIRRLGLTAMVIQGESTAILQRAVGHLADTALPGETGNVVLAGHRDTFFRPLKDIRAGDAISLKTLNGDFDYVVESTLVVPPSAIEVLEPSGGRTLTLITCFPFYFVGNAPNRFIVRARQSVPSSVTQ